MVVVVVVASVVVVVAIVVVVVATIVLVVAGCEVVVVTGSVVVVGSDVVVEGAVEGELLLVPTTVVVVGIDVETEGDVVMVDLETVVVVAGGMVTTVGPGRSAVSARGVGNIRETSGRAPSSLVVVVSSATVAASGTVTEFARTSGSGSVALANNQLAPATTPATTTAIETSMVTPAMNRPTNTLLRSESRAVAGLERAS